MTTELSSNYINKKVNALCAIFDNLEEELVYRVVQECRFDFNKASNTLAEMGEHGLNYYQDPDNKLSYQGKPNGAYANILNSIEKGYKVLVLMRGLPGSGKSTLSKELLYNSLGDVNADEFILSMDEYSFKSVDRGDRIKELDEARRLIQKKCFFNMNKGVSPIIIDNTNLEIWRMEVYSAMAVQFGYLIEIAVPLTDWALNTNVLASKNQYGFDQWAIEEMLKRFECQNSLTADDLLQEFNISYTDPIPQIRKYPPFVKKQSTERMNESAQNRKPPSPTKIHVHESKVGRNVASPIDVHQMHNQNKGENLEQTNSNDYESSNGSSEMNGHRVLPKQENASFDLESDNNQTEHNSTLNESYENITNPIKQGFKVLVLMRGLPGSGKSTLAKQLLHDSLGNVVENEFIFSVDQYSFKSENYSDKIQELHQAHQWNQKRCFSSMRKGVSPVIIDNANLEEWELHVYCSMAVKYSYLIEIAIPCTSWALNPKILSSKTKFEIRVEEIEEMLKRFSQNVTVSSLLEEFKLEYSGSMPQLRKYPPLSEVPQFTEKVEDSNVRQTSLSENASQQKKIPPTPMTYAKSKLRYDNVSSMKRKVDVVDHVHNKNDESKSEEVNTNANIFNKTEKDRHRSSLLEENSTFKHGSASEFIEHHSRLSESDTTIISFIKQRHKILVFMRGLPGSGKTTLARQLLHNSLGNVNRNEFIFSTDDYHFKSANYADRIQEMEEARQWNQKRCFTNTRKGVTPIIIDNSNLEMWEMNFYCAMAVKFGYIIEIATPSTSWALDPKILAMKNKDGLDESEIRDMLGRFRQNITAADLLREFNLKYTERIVQNRNDHPFTAGPRNSENRNDAKKNAREIFQSQNDAPEEKPPLSKDLHDSKAKEKNRTADVCDQLNHLKQSNANDQHDIVDRKYFGRNSDTTSYEQNWSSLNESNILGKDQNVHCETLDKMQSRMTGKKESEMKSAGNPLTRPQIKKVKTTFHHGAARSSDIFDQIHASESLEKDSEMKNAKSFSTYTKMKKENATVDYNIGTSYEVLNKIQVPKSVKVETEAEDVNRFPAHTKIKEEDSHHVAETSATLMNEREIPKSLNEDSQIGEMNMPFTHSKKKEGVALDHIAKTASVAFTKVEMDKPIEEESNVKRTNLSTTFSLVKNDDASNHTIDRTAKASSEMLAKDETSNLVEEESKMERTNRFPAFATVKNENISDHTFDHIAKTSSETFTKIETHKPVEEESNIKRKNSSNTFSSVKNEDSGHTFNHIAKPSSEMLATDEENKSVEEESKIESTNSSLDFAIFKNEDTFDLTAEISSGRLDKVHVQKSPEEESEMESKYSRMKNKEKLDCVAEIPNQRPNLKPIRRPSKESINIEFSKDPTLVDEEELLLNLNSEQIDQIKKLKGEFPKIPMQDLLDVYEKCGKKYFRTLDRIKNLPVYLSLTRGNDNSKGRSHVRISKELPKTKFENLVPKKSNVIFSIKAETTSVIVDKSMKGKQHEEETMQLEKAVIEETAGNISEESNNVISSEEASLNSRCSTDEEKQLLKLNSDEMEDIKKLEELFPNMSLESLLDAYEKCVKNYVSAVNLIKDIPTHFVSTKNYENLTRNNHPKNFKEECETQSSSFSVRDSKAKSKVEIAQEIEEESRKSEQQEEEIKLSTKMAELLDLKKQEEESVTSVKGYNAEYVENLKDDQASSQRHRIIEEKDDDTSKPDQMHKNSDINSKRDEIIEDLVELNLGNDLVQQLENIFGQPLQRKNVKTTVHIPKFLAKQLYDSCLGPK